MDGSEICSESGEDLYYELEMRKKEESMIVSRLMA